MQRRQDVHYFTREGVDSPTVLDCNRSVEVDASGRTYAARQDSVRMDARVLDSAEPVMDMAGQESTLEGHVRERGYQHTSEEEQVASLD